MAATKATLDQGYSAIQYHAEQPSVNSLSESEQNESDDDAQDYTDVAEADRNILQEEEEREKLLSTGDTYEKGQSFLTTGSRNGRGHDAGLQDSKKRPERSRKKRRRQLKRHGSNELMYEMEKGGLKDDTSSHSSSSSLELDRLNSEQYRVSKVSE